MNFKQVTPNFVQFGEHEWNTIQQMYTCLKSGGSYGVLCGDSHLGYAQPIGGVVAYRDQVSISGVGYDIGCGNLAVKTTADPDDVLKNIENIMHEINDSISFGVGRVNNERVDHELFLAPEWNYEPWKDLFEMAQSQLGTVGSGNHYVDIFLDDSRHVWVGVHFGSRGLGHRTATHFLHAGGGRDGTDIPPCVVSTHSIIGQDYLAGMRLAGRYAYAGREWVARRVAYTILHADIVDEIHNHHNFAWLEDHFGENYWVVRKGATPAFPGQRGFVGGSMGDSAYIIHGVQSEESKLAMYSTIHGAGRVMGRRAAKKTLDRKDVQAWLERKGVFVLGGDLDEAPQAYRRLAGVIKEQGNTIAVDTTLHPVGVCMAGGKVKDPYKD